MTVNKKIQNRLRLELDYEGSVFLKHKRQVKQVDEEEKQKDSIGSQLKQAGKEEIKKRKKAIIKKLLPKILPMILPILVGLIIVSSFTAVIQTVWEALQNLGSFLKGNQTVIELDDEKLDQLIASIEATGIDLEDLELLR